MKNIKILHTADLHLDSAFEALPAGKAAIRRAEQRELLSRLAELARSERVDVVLLAGDIFDGGGTYFETGAELVRCLRDMSVPVFIAPGNHDPYDAHSPYAKLDFPQNRKGRRIRGASGAGRTRLRCGVHRQHRRPRHHKSPHGARRGNMEHSLCARRGRLRPGQRTGAIRKRPRLCRARPYT